MSEGQKLYSDTYTEGEGQESRGELDLFSIAANMRRRSRLYRFLIVLAICGGMIAGLVWEGAERLTGNSAYAQAVITFSYEGIEEGLDPRGDAMDINKIKSPLVIESALDSLGDVGVDVETVRENLSIEGVIPEDAMERITALGQMAERDVSNYERILDVSYFSSQYIITLNRNPDMTPDQTRELLDEILGSYNAWFLDTYADAPTLAVVLDPAQLAEYDYAETAEFIRTQTGIMREYAAALCEEAPDFRSSETGLTFGDIAQSLETIESIEVANALSFIESNALTKDRQRQAEYYTYKIRQYSMELSGLQIHMEALQDVIDSYEKNPIVIVSGQENLREATMPSELYDSLVEQKLELSEEIARAQAGLEETTVLFEILSSMERRNTAGEFETADAMLAGLTETLSGWEKLTRETAKEYMASLFSNAVKIAVPAQYKTNGNVIKKILICVAAGTGAAVVLWCLDGLRMELAEDGGYKKKKREEQHGHS